MKELARLGINEKRITAIGLGESRPLIYENDLQLIEDKIKRLKADMKNERIEIIITSTAEKM